MLLKRARTRIHVDHVSPDLGRQVPFHRSETRPAKNAGCRAFRSDPTVPVCPVHLRSWLRNQSLTRPTCSSPRHEARLDRCTVFDLQQPIRRHPWQRSANPSALHPCVSKRTRFSFDSTRSGAIPTKRTTKPFRVVGAGRNKQTGLRTLKAAHERWPDSGRRKSAVETLSFPVRPVSPRPRQDTRRFGILQGDLTGGNSWNNRSGPTPNKVLSNLLKRSPSRSE